MDFQRRLAIQTLAGLGVAIGTPLSHALALAGTPEIFGLQSRTANVLDFGAKGDGTTDDTSSVQAAIDFAAMIFFPPGKYRVSAVKVDAGKYLFGAYKKSMLTAVGTGDMMTLGGGDVRVRDLMFTNQGGPRTSGAYIRSSGTFVHIENCYFENGYKGIVSNSTLFTISDCDFRTFASGAGVCIQINGGFNVYLDRIRSDHPANAMPFAGINIVSTGDTTITNSNLIHCGTDLLVNPGARQVVASLDASNTFFDTAVEGIALAPEGKGAIVRGHFVNCWTSSHQRSGTRINAGTGLIDGLTFIDHQANLNGGDGMGVAGVNSRNVYVLGGEMAGNRGAGIVIEEKVSKFYLHDLLAGAVHGLEGNDGGIRIKSGCTDYELVDCVCQSNRTYQVIDESKTGIVRGNVGITTRNRGASVIEFGETSVDVHHGLAATPSPGDISITPTVSFGANPLYLDTTSISATTFVVRCAAPAAGRLHFVWQASCLGA